MHRLAPVALATLLAATAPALLCAQAPTPFTPPQPTGHFTDPANLAGERVRPRDGRELPIDSPEATGGHGLQQILRKLNTRASLMLIVAHPDDEDGGMLTYYSRGLGARVAILTLNRGEGGQNAMTADFEDALGLLRTQELLSADRYMGVDQMFGTEVDFGFTKTKEEAFQKWNHQRVLYDAVRAVRIYRPLVIAAVFSGAVTDGHGQHQVSGEIAQEVFKAAADPNVFPELTKEGILPWQPLKVFARIPFSRVTAQGLYDSATGQTVPAEFTNYVTGQKFTTAPSADVTFNEGTPDPLLTYAAANSADLRSKPDDPNEQLSYVQFARIGLGLQRSQIGGGMRVPRPGRADVSYHLYGSRVCAFNLPNPTPDLCPHTTATSSRPDDLNHHPERSAQHINSNAVILSDRSEAKGVEEPRVFSSRENNSSLFHLVSRPTPSDEAAAKAPTARSITAQGNALGTSPNRDRSAEGAPYNASNPALANQPSFFDGIDTSFEGIASLAPNVPSLRNPLVKISLQISSALTQFDPKQPGKTAPALADISVQIDHVLDSIDDLSASAPVKENVRHELLIKRAQVQEALALALGLNFDASAPSADIDTGTVVKISARTEETSAIPLSIKEVHIQLGESGRSNPVEADRADRPLARDHADQRTLTIPAAETQNVTRPYFFRNSIEDPVYQLRVPALRNAPATPPAATAWANVDYRGTIIPVGRVVHSGDQPVRFIPPVNLFLSAHAQVLPLGLRSLRVQAEVQAAGEIGPKSTLVASVPDGWTVKPAVTPLHSGTTTLSVTAPAAAVQTITLKTVAHTRDNDHYAEGFRAIGYGSLPRTNFYTPATLRIVPVDLKLPPESKRRIAYLPGTGDDIPAALASIGMAPTILQVSDLTADKLSQFDTVILGVRTYAAHPDLHGAPTKALLDFARNGGNVVVQTQTPEFTGEDAPYPLTDRNERVIDETAPVKLLPDSKLSDSKLETERNPLLTTPNKITPADFNNWIEERGHGFLDSWDSHYTALTETADPGAPAEHIRPQEPQRGGLITVQLGKGRWTYVAFALYRQLPEAVPGAFRLFVNLLNP